MTVCNKATLMTKIAAQFPDNSVKQISPSTMRSFFTDLMDSLMNFTDATSMASSMTSVSDRVTALEGITPTASSLNTRLNTAEGAINSNATAIAAKADASALTSLTSRVGVIETWRGAKAANISLATSMPTVNAVTVLGLSVLTEASANGMNNAILELKGKINAILPMLQSREIMA